MSKVTEEDTMSEMGQKLGLTEDEAWEAEVKLYKSPTSQREAYLRAEIGLEYLEYIEYGHKSYRTDIEEAAREAILRFLDPS